MEIPLISEGREYISASRAAREIGYHSDYIGQLCRSQKVPGKLIGRTWYVDLNALKDHKSHKSLNGSEMHINDHQTVHIVPTNNGPIVYLPDDGPRLPELRKNIEEIKPLSRSRLVQEYVVLSLSLILFVGVSFSLTSWPTPSAKHMASVWSGASEVLDSFLKTFNLPQFTKKIPAAVKLAVEQNSPTLDFEALKSDLRLELEDFIRNEIPAERTQVVVRELQPIINTQILREEILRSDTRPIVTGQSSADSDRRSVITARLTDGGSFANSTLTSATVSGPTGSFSNFTFGYATGTSATTTNPFITTAS